MWNKKIITQTIEQSIKKGDLEKAEDACLLSISKGELSSSDKQFLKNSLLNISETHHNNLNFSQAIINSEHARILVPYDSKVLQTEMELLKKYFKQYKNQFVLSDIANLQVILNEIISDYTNLTQQSTFIPVLESGMQLINDIALLKENEFKDVESKHSFSIERILKIVIQAKFQHLSEEERREKVTKYLGKALKRVGIKKKIITPRKE